MTLGFGWRLGADQERYANRLYAEKGDLGGNEAVTREDVAVALDVMSRFLRLVAGREMGEMMP